MVEHLQSSAAAIIVYVGQHQNKSAASFYQHRRLLFKRLLKGFMAHAIILVLLLDVGPT